MVFHNFFRYEVANKYAVEHYRENTPIVNEGFYNFTCKIDSLMVEKILEVTNIDSMNTDEASKLLGELYRNGGITSKQVQ